MNVPIIRLELEGIKHTILTALSQYQMEIDKAVQESLEKICTEEYLTSYIDKLVKQNIDIAVAEEVKSFFSYNQTGQKAVREAVLNYLEGNFELALKKRT